MTNYIIQNYHSMTATQIAKELGVTKHKIRNEIVKLGLKKKNYNDYQKIASMLETMRPIEVAKATGINVNTIHTIKYRTKKQTTNFNVYQYDNWVI